MFQESVEDDKEDIYKISVKKAIKWDERRTIIKKPKLKNDKGQVFDSDMFSKGQVNIAV